VGDCETTHALRKTLAGYCQALSGNQPDPLEHAHRELLVYLVSLDLRRAGAVQRARAMRADSLQEFAARAKRPAAPAAVIGFISAKVRVPRPVADLIRADLA
jgi:hypothetical protein